jgi:hypothetical protein
MKRFVYPFVGGHDIENSTKVLDLCKGTGTALDGKHSSRKEIQVLWLQQAASDGCNTQVTPYMKYRELLVHTITPPY